MHRISEGSERVRCTDMGTKCELFPHPPRRAALDPITMPTKNTASRVLRFTCFAQVLSLQVHWKTFGHSMVVSPDGKILKELKKSEGVITVSIDPDLPKKLRSIIPSLKFD